MITFRTKTGLQGRVNPVTGKFCLLAFPNQPDNLHKESGKLHKWHLKLGDSAVMQFEGRPPIVLSPVVEMKQDASR